MSKVLLYSGGTDSWLIDKIWNPDKKIYIDIHGKYSEEEKRMLPNDVEIVDFGFLGITEDPNTLTVPLRNLYFLMIASYYGNSVCLGAVKGDEGQKDKRREFFCMAEDIMNYCTHGNSHDKDIDIIVNKDFVDMTKYDLVREYINRGGTIEKFIDSTFSCHHPIDGEACMMCKPCYRKFLVGYYYGYQYTYDQKYKMACYMRDNVVPMNKSSGTYFADRNGEGELAVKSVDKLFKEVFNEQWSKWT